MSVTVPAILKYLNSDNTYNIMGDVENAEGPIRAKKRRLDHLTWEEKIQRKKLKNRVAAQTSRDRKKAKMEQMEQALNELYEKNERLVSECERLREMNEKLTLENGALQDRLRVPCQNCAVDQSRSVECNVQDSSTEAKPRPLGLDVHSAASLDKRRMAAAATLKIALAYLLYLTYSTSSTGTSTSRRSRKLPRAYSRISPRIWKLLLRRQIAKNQSMQKRKNGWWGRHQKSWNPMEARG